MKKFVLTMKVGFLSTLFLLFAGCAKDYDDDFKRIDERLNALEKLTLQMNEDIQAIDIIVKALQTKDYITSVTPLPNGEGYTIKFDKQDDIIICNGNDGKDAPKIGAKADTDGIYYWTLDGKWLLDSNDQKMRVTAPTSPTPVMGINKDGYWTVDKGDGKGAILLLDASGNPVNAAGTNAPASSCDIVGNDVVITIGGTTFCVPYLKNTGLKFSDGNDLIYISYGAGSGANPKMILTLDLPATLTKADYQALQVSIAGKAGSDHDVSTRAITQGWKVEIVRKPEFNADGLIDQSAGKEVQIALSSPLDDATLTATDAVLSIDLLYSNGVKENVSRAVKVTSISEIVWDQPTAPTLTAPIDGKAANILLKVASISGPAILTIPNEITKENTPIITIYVTGTFSSTLQISGADYDGLVILQGSGGNTIVTDMLTVNLPKGSLTVADGTLGAVDITTKPKTFIVSSTAIAGEVAVRGGSIRVDGKVANITIAAAAEKVEQIVIAGIAEHITVEGEHKAAVTVTPEATAVGNIEAPKSEVIIQPSANGTKPTTVGAITADKASIGEGTTVGAVTAKDIVIDGTVTNNVTVIEGGSVIVSEGATTGDVDASKATGDVVIGGTTGAVTPPENPQTKPFLVNGNTYSTLQEAVNATTENMNTVVIKAAKYENPISVTIDKPFHVNIVGEGRGVVITDLAVTTVNASSRICMENSILITKLTTVGALELLLPYPSDENFDVAAYVGQVVGTAHYIWEVANPTQFKKIIDLAGTGNGVSLMADMSGDNFTMANHFVVYGNNRTITMTGSQGFVCDASLTLNDLTINASSTVGVAPVKVNKSDVVVTGNKLVINQSTSGTADGTGTSGLGILIPNGSIDRWTIRLTNSEINLNGTKGYQRGIASSTAIEQAGAQIYLTNSKIISKLVNGSNATYSIGISMAKLKDVVVKLDNTFIDGVYYPINCAGDYPDNLQLTVDCSQLTGYCALNLRGTSTVKILNGSVLTGRNTYPKGSNDFSTIVFNRGVVSQASLLVDNSTVKIYANNTSLQNAVDLRGNSNITVSFVNNSKLMDNPLDPNMYINYMIIGNEGSNVSITKDATVILEGKEGVGFYEHIE